MNYVQANDSGIRITQPFKHCHARSTSCLTESSVSVVCDGQSNARFCDTPRQCVCENLSDVISRTSQYSLPFHPHLTHAAWSRQHRRTTAHKAMTIEPTHKWWNSTSPPYWHHTPNTISLQWAHRHSRISSLSSSYLSVMLMIGHQISQRVVIGQLYTIQYNTIQ